MYSVHPTFFYPSGIFTFVYRPLFNPSFGLICMVVCDILYILSFLYTIFSTVPSASRAWSPAISCPRQFSTCSCDILHSRCSSSFVARYLCHPSSLPSLYLRNSPHVPPRTIFWLFYPPLESVIRSLHLQQQFTP